MNTHLKEKIEDLEQKHRLIADNLLDAIWVIDAETLKYEYITPSVERVSGYKADEFINLTLEKILTPESLSKALRILAEERKRFEKGINTARTIELERISREGFTKWIEVRARFYKEKDNCLKIVGVTRDIDERKKAELKQNELIEKLGKALAEKEKLLEENKVLRGLLPICSGCRRIRDESGKWWPLVAYVEKKTDAKMTHTICDDCTDIYYGTL